MKKIFFVILLLTAFMALTSCGGTNPTGYAPDSLGEGVEPEPPSAEALVTQNEDYFIVEDSMPAVSTYSGYSDKVYGFGFKKSQKGITPSIGIYADFLNGVDAVYIGDTNQQKIYLTFDEGYENGYTGKILDVLKEKNVPAAFFCTGDYLVKNDELVYRMVNEGHIVGNHTWNHPTLPNVSEDSKFKEELTKIDDHLNGKYGIKTTYFRYPNGEFSEKSLHMVKDAGYKTVFWSLAYKDWERDVVQGADYAMSQIVNHIHNGAVILLHAVSADNADALSKIIDQLRAENYEFVSLDELTFN